MLYRTIAIACIPLYLFATLIQIPFYVIYDGTVYDEVIVVMSSANSSEGVDCLSFKYTANQIFKKEGIENHPLVNYPCKKELLNIADLKALDILADIDTENFELHFTIPSRYLRAKQISLKEPVLQATITPEKFRGWLNIFGNLIDTKEDLTHSGLWKLNASYENTHFSSSGNYFLQGNFEKKVTINHYNIKHIYAMDKKSYEVQIGTLMGTNIVSGQSMSAKYGISYSNIIDTKYTTTTLDNLGGGEFLIEEDSQVEISLNDTIIKKISLPRGKYTIKDLVTVPGENQFKIRVETISGIVTETIINIDTAYSQLQKGAYQYVIHSGRTIDKNQLENGFAFKYAPTNYLNLGLHYNNIIDNGDRVGLAAEYFYNKEINLHLDAYKENYLSTNLENSLRLDVSYKNFGYHYLSKQYDNTASGSAIVMEHRADFSLKPPLINSMRFSLGEQTRYDTNKNDFFGVSSQYRVNKRLSVSASYYQNTYPINNYNLYVSFNFNLFPNLSASYAFNQEDKKTVGLQHKFNSNVNLNNQYNETKTNKSNRAQLNYNTSMVDTTLTSNWNKQNLSEKGWENSSNKLYYTTALVFTKDAISIVPKVQNNFIIVDASNIEENSKIKVKIGGENIENNFGRFSKADMRASKIDIDASDISFAYDMQKEVIVPTLYDGYYLKVINNKKVIVISELFLPNGKPAKLLYGFLINSELNKKLEWFTDAKGKFYFEGEPGMWKGIIYIEDKAYNININIEDEDLLKIDPIFL